MYVSYLNITEEYIHYFVLSDTFFTCLFTSVLDLFFVCQRTCLFQYREVI